MVCLLSPYGGSHLSQFASIVVDNGLAPVLGMPDGGYSNTWEWTEVLVFPISKKPIVSYMWNIGHTLRPNGEILEGGRVYTGNKRQLSGLPSKLDRPGPGITGTMNEQADTTSPSLYRRYRGLSLGTKILIYMVVGIIAGIVFGERTVIVKPLGNLFIRLLIMAAIPLVFFNLLAGLTSLSDLSSLGRLSARIITYYFTTTILALTLGLTIMNLLKPGRGMTLKESVSDNIGEVPSATDILLDLVPQNVFHAFSSGNVAQIVVFAVFLGVTTLLLPQEHRRPLQKAFSNLAELLRKLVGLILYVAPIGIGALAAVTVGQYGSKIFGPLALFIGGVWTAQLIMVIFYLTLLYTLTRQSPIDFLKKSAPLYATTVATCSSLASLVVSMDIAEKKMKIPKSIYTFTLPLGAQINKDGTSIMLAGVLLFTAQATGVEFDIYAQINILLVGLILSEGSGGIPGGGFVIALIFVKAFNLPLEIAVIVGGIYRLIDMGGTTINCMGDMVGTVIVAHYEKRRESAMPESQADATA